MRGRHSEAHADGHQVHLPHCGHQVHLAESALLLEQTICAAQTVMWLKRQLASRFPLAPGSLSLSLSISLYLSRFVSVAATTAMETAATETAAMVRSSAVDCVDCHLCHGGGAPQVGISKRQAFVGQLNLLAMPHCNQRDVPCFHVFELFSQICATQLEAPESNRH